MLNTDEDEQSMEINKTKVSQILISFNHSARSSDETGKGGTSKTWQNSSNVFSKVGRS